MVIEQFQQLGYKAEAVELTAETLAAANYGTVWTDPLVQDESTYNPRAPRRASFSKIQGAGGTSIGKFTGKFEPRPSGTDATAPDWYALMAAAGATITGDVATFGAAVASSALVGTPVTIKHRDGAYERTLAGARFSKLTFAAEKGALWECDAEATGRYTQATQTAFVAAANPTAGLGQPFLGMTCTIDATPVIVNSASISIENTVTPRPDATHASGLGNNVITAQSLKLALSIMEEGTTDWRGKYRNDAAADLLAVSLQMSAGAAGNVLTWTGTINLTEQPTITYVGGIGYVQLAGEFVSASDSASLTLTQT